MTDHERRFGDRDGMLNDRLDSIEKDYQQMARQVTALEAKLSIVQLEQGHLKDLFDARLKVLEKSMELQLAETKGIALNIQQMGSDTDKTPAGRIVQGQLGSIRATLDEQCDTIKSHELIHTALKDWQLRVEGVLILLKWIGAGGLVALGLSLLKLLKVIP